MRVQLVGWTTFRPPDDVPWTPRSDDADADALAEFAGRACYLSWSRPNPATATNAAYVANVIDLGHESVLEHASATFWVTGISRSLSHELVRHRHLSFSQVSQRYVNQLELGTVYPPALADDDAATATLHLADRAARSRYVALVELVAALGLPRKRVREAARAALPGATETRLVVTGNLRAWRHVVRVRGADSADLEARAFAAEVLDALRALAPATFADLEVATLGDGYAGVRPA